MASTDWTITDTMYLLIALFCTATVCFLSMGFVFRRLAARRRAAAPATALKKGLKFPEPEANPTQFWSSNITDVNEPMRHFYPSSKMFSDPVTDRFSGY